MIGACHHCYRSVRRKHSENLLIKEDLLANSQLISPQAEAAGPHSPKSHKLNILNLNIREVIKDNNDSYAV